MRLEMWSGVDRNELVASILKRGRQKTVFSVTPSTGLHEAMALMAVKTTPVLLIVSGETLVGILFEQDCARKLMSHGASGQPLVVCDLMMCPPITVTPDTTLDECLLLAEHHCVRFLPVLDQGKVIAMVSVDELVNGVICQQAQMIRQLLTYIEGPYPA
ncbi:CBS domain-containing protein [Candidatus Sumerlaeota bacterium]|nr:CBS domain-containing protein [Candidatus Sumerlaeota bacterium]